MSKLSAMITVVASLVMATSLGFVSMASAADEEAGSAAADHDHGDEGHGDEGHGGADHGDGHGDGHEVDANPLKADVPLAMWSLVTFLIFLALLKVIAWKPMSEGLAKREHNIRSAIEEAQAARDEAAKLLADHEAKIAGTREEVDAIIAEARRDAEHTASEIKEKAESEAETTRARVLNEIDRAKDQAIAELASRERDLIADATESVLGRALTDDDRGRLIDEALSQFGQN